MSVAYRDGRPGDGPALSDLFCESFAATFGHLYAEADLAAFLCKMDADAFEGELASSYFAFRLAEEEDGRLGGYAKLGPNDLPGEAPPATLELYQLYLRAGWHGTGVARCLMDWVLAEARRRGATHLQLSVYVDNHRARRFYEKYGFEEVGKYVFMVGNHADDDRIMRLEL
jgi:ribosomal protein S18 acetylase RimI-like enzyme